MSKLIEKPFSNSSVIFADNRTSRPHIMPNDHTTLCPFCLENERLLEQVWMERSLLENESIRIVNNKYPICDTQGELYGVHDVVIDTVDHVKRPIDFSVKHWCALLEIMQERWKILSKDSRINFIQIFKNYGVKAGASISHSHWQIVGLEKLPAIIYQEQIAMFNSNNKCLLCELIENLDTQYCIEENELFVSIAPENSIYPYETWLIPKQHYKNYGDLPKSTLDELGRLLKKILMTYELCIPNMQYNICFMSGELEAPYHFFVKIFPRTGNVAGFELATGCYINIMDPKEHMKQMQEATKKLLSFN